MPTSATIDVTPKSADYNSTEQCSTLTEMLVRYFARTADVTTGNLGDSRVNNTWTQALLCYVMGGYFPKLGAHQKIAKYDLEIVMNLYGLAPDYVREIMDPVIEGWKREVYGDADFHKDDDSRGLL